MLSVERTPTCWKKIFTCPVLRLYVSRSNRSPAEKGSVVDEITAGVASLEQTTPDQLRPLYEVIDTEALENLFRETRGQLTFEYLDYEVTVHHDYSVEISPR